jgi:two-component system, cell cycle sensor histidine kinase and response regulator CckA
VCRRFGGTRTIDGAALMRDDEPSIESPVPAVRDQGDRITGELAQQYRLLFERSSRPMYVVDVETRRFLAVNDAAVAEYGYARDEFRALWLDDIWPEADRAACLAPVPSASRGRIAGSHRHQRKDGSLLDVEVSSDAMTFDARPAWLISVHDVSPHVRAEVALHEARRQMELLLASAGEGIVALDADARTTFVNPVAARLLGATPETILGRDLDALLHHSRAAGALYDLDHCPIRRSLLEGTVHRVDTDVFWRPDGTSFPVEYVCTPLSEEGHIVGVVIAFQDVTQRKQLEQQLLQARKMEALGQLAGGVAHDFNNLLTVITGYSEMLLAETRADDVQREDLEEIRRAAHRAAALTRQLLAFSRQQMLEPRVLDLHAVIRGIEKMLRCLIREDVDLQTALAPELGQVFADPGQLEQVLVNLVVNARDAMPHGGTLTIETADVTIEAAHAARHVGVKPGRYVMLAVRDDGVGMNAETRARIFEPFYTTKSPGHGTGLGLSTVHGIVQQSGGHVCVETAPGEGSTFRVYLPRVGGASAQRPPSGEHAVVRRGTETVLLVEDEPQVRAASRRILERAGYRVLEARTGADAFRRFEELAAAVDLIVTDVVMPEMSGRELVARARAVRPALPVLFLSGYTDAAALQAQLLEPVNGFLQKPFTPEKLSHKVREVLDAAASVARASADPVG